MFATVEGGLWVRMVAGGSWGGCCVDEENRITLTDEVMMVVMDSVKFRWMWLCG